MRFVNDMTVEELANEIKRLNEKPNYRNSYPFKKLKLKIRIPAEENSWERGKR